jgi:ABC-type cobalamin/Fe3+-siderophores transport system ATPase subunit
MQLKFSPSTNIVRDTDKEINYIVTPNSKEVFNNIINNLKSGNKVFNLIGSYGTGKSTFLWALQQNLSQNNEYFVKLNGQFNGIHKFEFIKLIGDSKPLSEALLHTLDFKNENPHEIAIEKLNEFYINKCKKRGKFLFIIIDEFGKFLEYAAKGNLEKELYFIQQLAEYVNDESKNIILISTLHQGFSSYSKNLSKEQRNEWEKVKGRIKEVSFNEPVEQLVKLSASFIHKNYNFKYNKKNLNTLNDFISDSKSSVIKEIDEIVLNQIYPLELLSSSVLVQSLQKYGQNERSLFSFLASSDPYALSSFNEEEKYFNIVSVYNYINHNFFSYINSKFNPDFSKWSVIKTTIEKVKGRFTSDIEDRIKIIKAIGLLNIFASKQIRDNKDFIVKYAKSALNISNAKNLIKDLEKKQLIRYATYANQYILFGGTDLDIDIALLDAESRVDSTSDISTTINKYVEMPVVVAKRYMLERGTSRFFKFNVSNDVIKEISDVTYDGEVNIILSSKIKKKDLDTDKAILYCNITDLLELKNSVYEIRKIEYVIKDNIDDKVAVSELQKLKNSEANKVRRIILSDIYKETSKWYYNSKKVKINSLKKLNSTLSDISDIIYSDTPIFHNELINKSKLSGSISTARRNLFINLIEKINKVNLSYPNDKFPPDKTIYLTLLKNTGIHTVKGGKFQIGKIELSIKKLWDASNEFISSASKQTKSLVEFINILKSAPFGLKQGLIDHWVGIFLILKSNEFALYYKGQYVAELNKDNLELIYKSPKDFTIKSYDISGNKLLLFNRYRDLTQLNVVSEANTTSFIQTIRPFLILARQLEEVTKNTKNFKDKRTLELRESIVNATDPEKLFFEDFPAVYSIFNISELSDDDMLKYINDLAFSIKELTSYYQKLVENTYHKFEDIFGENIDFKKFKRVVNKRYSSLKPDLLPSHIKTFFNRVSSALDDKESWINSVVQDLVGSTLQNITDTDLEKLDNRLKKSFLELDHLVDLHKVELNKDQEVYRIEVTTTKGGDIPQQFIVDEKDHAKVDLLADQLEKILSSDSNINKVAIINLLKRLKNE